MDKIGALSLISGALLVFYGIVANAYWNDAVRWDKESEDATTQQRKQMARKNKNMAARLFRFATLLAVLALLAAVLPIYLPALFVAGEIILLFPTAVIVILAVYFFLTGRSFVAIGFDDEPESLLTLIGLWVNSKVRRETNLDNEAENINR